MIQPAAVTASMFRGAAGETVDRWLEWLGDLATYRPSDFLMFSPRTYWRMFELHNEAWWPLPVLLPGLALAAGAWLWRGGAPARRVVPVALAVASGFVAHAFVLRHYEPINWAARGLVWMWWAQALALLALASTRVPGRAPDAWRRRAAWVLAAWALLAHPMLAPLSGRPLAQAEVVGLAPDPTAIAVLAWLVQGSVAGAGWLARAAWSAAWGLALALCGVSAATLAVLEDAQAAVMLAAPLVALGALASRRIGRIRRTSR